MKKIFILSLLVLAFVSKSFALNLPSSGAVLYEKQGGQFVWFMLSVRYNKVITSIMHDPNTGLDYFLVYCEGPGYEKCQRVPDNAIQNSTCPHINHPAVLNIEDEIMGYIDNQLVNMNNFQGAITKKVEITNGGRSYIYAVTAKWYNGNNNGDASIIVSYNDITEMIPSVR